MCLDCGCNQPGNARIIPDPGQASQGHHHDHHHHHEPALNDYHNLDSDEAKAKVLSRNRHIAEHNREHLDARGVFCINLISAPGSGKTALLEQLLGDERLLGQTTVIEGDLETENDAVRIRRAGAPAIQVNTGHGCHLDAHMIHNALHQAAVPEGGMLIIENVGNMVCPADFDLGEHHKIAMISCTEGDDKPAKYPGMIKAASALLISKTDLLPHLDFDVARCKQLALELNKDLAVFEVSATTRTGIAPFADWLEQQRHPLAVTT